MKLQQLRYFIAVCRLGSITRAAASLHISQPSITLAIKDLESELNLNLFHRINHRLVLTKEGTHLLGLAEHLLAEHDAALEEMQGLTRVGGVINLGLPVQVGTYLMPVILGEFRKKNPDISFSITEAGALAVKDLLLRESLDIAVISSDKEAGNGFSSTELFQSEYCVCVNKAHRLAERDTITIKDLAHETLVLLDAGFHVNLKTQDLFTGSGLKPEILLCTSQLGTIKNLILHNLACSILLKEAVENDPYIQAVRLIDMPPLKIQLITKAGRRQSSAVQTLIAFLKKKTERGSCGKESSP